MNERTLQACPAFLKTAHFVESLYADVFALSFVLVFSRRCNAFCENISLRQTRVCFQPNFVLDVVRYCSLLLFFYFLLVAAVSHVARFRGVYLSYWNKLH